MKKLLPLALALLLLLSACGNKSTSKASYKSFYNSSLGKSVAIGMAKDDIDSVFGDPEMSDDVYYYSDYSLYATYSDGHVASMWLEFPSDSWSYANGVSGTPNFDDIKADWGEPSQSNNDGRMVYYYFGSNGKLVDSNPKYGVGFALNSDNSITDAYVEDSSIIQK